MSNTKIDGYFQVFFDYVRQLVDIPEGDQQICREYFKPTFVKKGTIIAKAGTVHQHHNFIVSGYMRNFHHDEEGREVTIDLNDGPRFFTSYHHFIQRTPSNENLQCITDCELLRITRDNMDTTAQLGETQMDYSMRVLEHHLEKNRQRTIDLATLSAEQRYRKLMQQHPDLLLHVPLKYLASYLGINPGSLSRIRKEIG